MEREKVTRITFNILVITLLVISIVRLALAAPELQGGNRGSQAAQPGADLSCAQTYVVQRDDTLSLIARKYYGDVLAYHLIFQATNAAVGSNGFTPIRDPDIIEPGQVLCIPAWPVAGPGTAGSVITATAPITPTPINIAGLSFNLAPEQGVLLVENRAGGDFVFDLTQPKPASAVVAPNHLQPFIVPAGLQGYMGHHPIGQFSLTPGQVQVAAGQITHLICFRGACQPASSVQPPASPSTPAPLQVNQPVVAGQPPPPAVDNNNNNNGNDNNSNGNNNNNNNNNNNGNDNNNNNNNNGNDNNSNNNNNNNS